MNKTLRWLALTLFLICSTNTSIASTISINAVNDVKLIDSGSVPFYRDKRNNALGIDARVSAYRNLFARAEMEFNGESGHYDITITTITEEDGEPLFRLWVNNELVGLYRNTYIGEGSSLDLQPEKHTWQNIALNTHDVIAIEANAHTNGEIPEHGGTAWARGRWRQLDITLTDPLTTNAQTARPRFRKHSDLLLTQFDLKPDADDIHAVAALGSMLKHDDLSGVNVFAVAGSVGTQKGPYIQANSLFKLAFGKQGLNWTDAHTQWQQSVLKVRDRVRATLAQGGNVWVQEAGQSDFTRDWIAALLEAGIDKQIIKNSVIVVQHSDWNEQKTTPQDLAFVKKHTHYQPINDGNKPKLLYIRKGRRGPFTPSYVAEGSKWLDAATSDKNSRKHARALWQEAAKLVKQSQFNADYSVIPKGGVDFSDIVENWWIFDLGQAAVSVHHFWERYVTDVELDKIAPPKGRLAIVADGNSPDPDDIGATPVMFGMLKQTGLSDRLVHLSHSCDLDPFRNKARWQIDPENEARRQAKLHELSIKGTSLFGPFNQLRNVYNCRSDKEGAVQDLVDAINASSQQDPLWIVEAGEPDLIGYALQASDKSKHQFVHVISHHPANDNSGDYFTWQQILDFGVTEHQIGDQNVGLQSAISEWDWIEQYDDAELDFIQDMLAYAEADGVVPFQANHYDCSDAGMVYWWITGADKGGNNTASPADIKDMLLLNK
jgi:hypothetical protein